MPADPIGSHGCASPSKVLNRIGRSSSQHLSMTLLKLIFRIGQLSPPCFDPRKLGMCVGCSGVIGVFIGALVFHLSRRSFRLRLLLLADNRPILGLDASRLDMSSLRMRTAPFGLRIVIALSNLGLRWLANDTATALVVVVNLHDNVAVAHSQCPQKFEP